jgi:hypothetical protein
MLLLERVIKLFAPKTTPILIYRDMKSEQAQGLAKKWKRRLIYCLKLISERLTVNDLTILANAKTTYLESALCQGTLRSTMAD